MPARIELNARERRSLVRAYERGEGLAALADEHGMAIQTIRRLLVEAGVTIRPRGRPALS